jgi:hypothetical protein
MKKLKYIKLYKAFESLITEAFGADHLNKVFNYLKDSSSKNRFKNDIISVASHIDAPVTLISDEYFQYLPYKKAIKSNVSLEQIDCPSCEGTGSIKRAWGRGFRTLKCDKCDGGGKVNPAGKLKYLKFWLNSKGEYIGTTGVDGNYHANKNDVAQFKKIDITSELIELVRTINNRGSRETMDMNLLKTIMDKYEIKNGTKLFFENWKTQNYNNSRNIIGSFFKSRNRNSSEERLYLVNNTTDYYDYKPSSPKWRDLGNKLMQLTGIWDGLKSLTGFNSGTRVYILTDIEEREDILYNVGVNFSKSGFSLNDSFSKNFLNDAEFSIIFDFEKWENDLVAKGFKPLSQQREERKDAKSGIIGGKLGTSDDQIKKANIERYLKTLSDVDLFSGFGKLFSKNYRFFGERYSLHYIKNERNFTSFRNNISNLKSFLKSDSDEVRKHYSEKISERIRETLVANDDHNKRLDNNIKNVYEIISNYDNSEQFLEVATLIFDKISETSIKISNKIKTFNNECLEDYEVAYSKIVSINNLLNNRLDLDRDFAYVIYYLDRNPSSVIDYLKSYLFVNRYSSNYEITDSIRQKISQDFSKLDYLFRFTDRL